MSGSTSVRPAKTVREVLIAARWILEHNGWTRGNMCERNGVQSDVFSARTGDCFCAMGAIWATESNEDLRQRSLVALRVFAAVSSIPYWNDAPGRTKADVLAAFDRAIEAHQ